MHQRFRQSVSCCLLLRGFVIRLISPKDKFLLGAVRQPLVPTYTGLPLDAIEDALQRSTSMQNARGILVRKQQKLTGRPLLPLHAGSVGLLACAGLVNGFVGQGEMRHIADWRSVKHVDGI